ncbi:chitin deacetylase [Entomortierella chlamydospora]|uniref:Chitin deacetylase n=1 Tax=Entomortierella chlamydospora TaxID=101097 RepID=A0A9P6T4G1_9FUNG|nr:chitin deacetylase [Entomortierella chlamydospora]KAG0024112.1 chitin deacetylase [Entomortierella chlamydospora]
MSPFSRLALVATLFATAFVCAAPVSPSQSGPSLQKRSAANVIYQCTIPGTIAITFDDGPFLYTNGLLDILKSRNVKATFFMNGQNYGNINDFAASVKRVYDEGHQIGHHTWDHQDLTALSSADALAEMTKLEDAFKNILGVRPRYMRPPFGSVNAAVLEMLGERNYTTAVVWDTDTMDWSHPTDFQASYSVYESLLNNTDGINQPGHIVLEHEVNQVTALQLAPMAIDLALIKGYKVVTVGECLGDPQANWYTV